MKRTKRLATRKTGLEVYELTTGQLRARLETLERQLSMYQTEGHEANAAATLRLVNEAREELATR